jgi:Sugar (and other) transporter.
MVNLNHDYQKLMGIYPLEGRFLMMLYSKWFLIVALGSSRNTAAEGGIVAVYYGGTMVGALMAGALADRCGRVKAIVFGCLWVVLGAALQASAYNITWMCFGRVIGEFRIAHGTTAINLTGVYLAGIGVGAIDCVIPVWSAEVSSHSARGAFLALEFVMVCILRIPKLPKNQTDSSGLEYWRPGNGLLDRILRIVEF